MVLRVRSSIEKPLTQPDADWAKAVTAVSDIEAHLIGGRLEEAGVEVLMEPDRTGYGDYLLGGGNPHAPVHIFVRSHQLDRAAEVIAEIEDDDDEEEIFIETGSDEQDWYPEDPSAPLAAPARRSSVRAVMAFVILGVVGALLYRDLAHLLDM